MTYSQITSKGSATLADLQRHEQSEYCECTNPEPITIIDGWGNPVLDIDDRCEKCMKPIETEN